MKTPFEIDYALRDLPSTADHTKFPNMSYESGWEEALLWVLEYPEAEDIEPPTD